VRLLILADIHANVSALEAVLDHARIYSIDQAVFLGDAIDYGMRPNETITLLKQFPYPIDVNIWGNHENALAGGDVTRFSSERGREFSAYTSKILSKESKRYILEQMNINGNDKRNYGGKAYLLIHGSLEDIFWKSISVKTDIELYRDYDYVLCGHSHIPFYFEKYAEAYNLELRNKKKIVFINPGSVGQPRNHQSCACYAVLDTSDGWVHLNTARYNIAEEQKLYTNEVDEFYKTRLERGI
jgi:predicted phosphodiesterase